MTRLTTLKYILIIFQIIAGLYLLKSNLKAYRTTSARINNNHPLQSLTNFVDHTQKPKRSIPTLQSLSSAEDKIRTRNPKILNTPTKLEQSLTKTHEKRKPKELKDHERYHPHLGHRVPSYMIIGAMKGGTTTLTKMLENHPEVFRSKLKELHFFDSWNHNPKKSNITASLQHFYELLPVKIEHGFSDKAIGDSTPRYILMSDIIPTIKKLCP